jgi:sensor histidine kinase YesM
MKMYDFIFSGSYPLRLYRHAIFWMTLYVFTLITYFHPFLEKTGFSKWMSVQSEEMCLHILTQMIFCYSLLYYLLPFLYKKRYTTFIAGFFLLSAVTIYIYYAEHILLFSRIHRHAGMSFMQPPVVLWFTVISFLTYFPRTAALVLAIKIIKNWRARQQENQQLAREKANAELQLLKAQIHPHFLFNTLNNIYSFALNKSPQAAMLIQKLSGTLHYMINECETKWVPLEKEMDMIRDYIELERIRYGDRLDIRMEISGDFSGMRIAPLLMIPFVENSFKHGASQVLDSPWIRLTIQMDGGVLRFGLNNSRPHQLYSSKGKCGIGLSNVRKRLELLYPSQHELRIEPGPVEFAVWMVIPVHEMNDLTPDLFSGNGAISRPLFAGIE